MGEEEDLSRRDLMRNLGSVFRRSAARFADSLPQIPKQGKRRKKKAPIPGVKLPRFGELVDGLPAVHPWIAIAHGAAAHLGRRYPYALLMGASGEAFKFACDPENPSAAAAQASMNTFLAALAVTGVAARATQGGPFEPAIGGIEVAMSKGLVVVVATSDGPGTIAKVHRRARAVSWDSVTHGRRKHSFEEFDGLWEAGAWMNGPAPWLRVMLEPGGAPRPLDQVAKVGLESMRMLLSAAPETGPKQGLAALQALADFVDAGPPDQEAVEQLFGPTLTTFAVARMAAGMFLDAISRAFSPDERDGLTEAARAYGEIHAAPPLEGIWGTGLLPELAECVLTDGRPDAAKLEDDAVRHRARDLLLQIRSREAAAVQAVAPLLP
jgi:hypothetical protein